MSSAKGFVIVIMDLRGSGFQGDRHRKEVYRRLGELEVQDAIHVIRESSKLPFIEKDRISIWGWSFGGFLVPKIIAKNNRFGLNLIKSGIAVSPVAKWQYYDSVYTERYMCTPTSADNWEGYDQADLTKDMKDMKDDQLLLVHGTADENVQLVHTMLLTKKLTYYGIVFNQMIYPDENHGLVGVLPHLFSLMEDFLLSTLGNSTIVFPEDVTYTLSDMLTN
ncbi:venom dipeptidyl peptidase 4 [Eurytemora carolleeae]|uniref:venom dipeptidyl peptidase 4 n=1 Tax=Eurytemora carolleeae TaxID=1294199 RepID=UPI000C76948A|nr:venom dipeptidyl peptidase 4 [Eurytemora carolleeae]|eukprot:XP_023328522.1 venom dipeptidyl peptidase 4-like [Eurytemora affinis]